MKKQSQTKPNYDGSWFRVQRLIAKLKKQSQFVPGISDISPYKLNGYGDFLSAGSDENKANQTRFDAPFGPEEMLKSEKPPTAATG